MVRLPSSWQSWAGARASLGGEKAGRRVGLGKRAGRQGAFQQAGWGWSPDAAIRPQPKPWPRQPNSGHCGRLRLNARNFTGADPSSPDLLPVAYREAMHPLSLHEAAAASSLGPPTCRLLLKSVLCSDTRSGTPPGPVHPHTWSWSSSCSPKGAAPREGGEESSTAVTQAWHPFPGQISLGGLQQAPPHPVAPAAVWGGDSTPRSPCRHSTMQEAPLRAPRVLRGCEGKRVWPSRLTVAARALPVIRFASDHKEPASALMPPPLLLERPAAQRWGWVTRWLAGSS